MSDTQPLTDADIARLVDRFYDKVRVDPELGPIFNPAVADWEEHKAMLVRFWSSILLGTRTYRGNPMAMHRPHPIDAGHFDLWLALWRETAAEVLPAEHAAVSVEHAGRIARSLMVGLGLDANRRPLGQPFADR